MLDRDRDIYDVLRSLPDDARNQLLGFLTDHRPKGRSAAEIEDKLMLSINLKARARGDKAN